MKPLRLRMAPLTPGHPDDGRFAIACTGTTHTRHTMDATEHVASGELPRQIYVIAPAANGRFHEMLWEFTCEKTEIPVFDLSRRRF